MSGEIVQCSKCKQEYEATTEEVASYLCPKCFKPKGKVKLLDQERFNILTKVDDSENDGCTTHSEDSSRPIKEN